MAEALTPILDLSSLSLYKAKSNSVTSLASQKERRNEALRRQKDKRNELVSQLRFAAKDDEPVEPEKPQWPPRPTRKSTAPPPPIGMMLAEWLFVPPDDLASWFVVPCPRGQRCLVVVQSHRALVYGKHGQLMWTMHTQLPKHTVLYCIYDKRSSIYHILDLIMWNGQDYSTQIECQCRFFVLTSLGDDARLSRQFRVLPRMTMEDKENLLEAEDGYLFYHPLGFYEDGYSPLVCWLQPFMIEEMLGVPLSYPVEKPAGYTTAQAFMFDEQSHRKEHEQQRCAARKPHRRKKEHVQDEETTMSVDAPPPPLD